MPMRSWVHQTVPIWMAIFLAAWMPPSAPAAEAPQTARTLSQGWKFSRGERPGAEAAGMDDSAWNQVLLPHTWNIKDAATGDKRRFYRGTGWYRLRLPPDPSWEGRSLFLHFGAAYATAEVFINGQPAGRHRGGYSAFCVDATRALRRDRENIVAVRVNNEEFDGPPIGGDFTKFGGLYRPVTLLALEPLSLDPMENAGPGVRVRQAEVSHQAARLEIAAALRNGGGTGKSAEVRCRLLDAQGKEAAAVTGSVTLPADSRAQWTGTMTVPLPHLWQGIEDPYLYRLDVEVRDGERVVDSATEEVGLRFFHADPEKGFFLNGKPYPLRGVNRHQDTAGKGSAVGEAELRRDLDLLRELGCTAVRLVHYQHGPEFYRMCDEAGLVVWAEPALVNDIDPYSPAFIQSAREQLTELIRQSGNHPSICIWGLWNEWTLVKKLRGKQGSDEAAARFFEEMNRLAKELDPTRLTVAASCDARHLTTARIPDLLGWNSYPGWYTGEPHDLGWMLDELRQKCPGASIGVSEHGAGSGLLHHADDPPRGAPEKAIHTEERQAIVLEGHFAEIDRRPWLWCDFVWQLADSSSIMRQEGDRPGINDKGLVSYDRKVKKDAFYLCKARWSREPFVHITSRRFTLRPAGRRTVKVYSNAERAELWINGQPQGIRTGSGGVFRWSGVELRPGENRVRAVGIAGGKTVEDTCIWNTVSLSKTNPAHPPAGSAKHPTP